jgi:hypothetical protein
LETNINIIGKNITAPKKDLPPHTPFSIKNNSIVPKTPKNISNKLTATAHLKVILYILRLAMFTVKMIVKERNISKPISIVILIVTYFIFVIPILRLDCRKIGR